MIGRGQYWILQAVGITRLFQTLFLQTTKNEVFSNLNFFVFSRKLLDTGGLTDEECLSALENRLKETDFFGIEMGEKNHEIIDQILRSLFSCN